MTGPGGATGRGARIIGWGTALPEEVLTNADLEARLDTSDAWITERTGIKERRIGGSTVTMAVEAGRAAIASAGVDPSTVDLLVLCTSSPDKAMPASATTVQAALGLTCGAFDLNAACAGFTYGLVTANGLASTGARRILLIGSDALYTRMTDPDDRATAILFGDGAGAVVLDAIGPDEPAQLLGWHAGSDGNLEHILFAEHGGFMQMDGREVFRRAVRAVVDSIRVAMDRAGVTTDDITLVVLHQANIRIVDAISDRLGFRRDQHAIVVGSTGNTSAGSIPLGLADGLDARRVSDGDLVVLSGFGAGMSWSSVVLRWSDAAPIAIPAIGTGKDADHG